MSIQPIRPLELMKDSRMTKFDCQDFIGVWEDFVPASLCETIINTFEGTTQTSSLIHPSEDDSDIKTMDGTDQFTDNNLGRKDLSIALSDASPTITYQVQQYLQSCALHYINFFGQLKSCRLMSTDVKMQKTEPMGGYHVWHYENSTYFHSPRELVWMIYLNTLPENEGETEFLYQKRRIRPTQGTVVFWPAGMTHVHRGLTVYTQDKYILTGWYLKTP